MYEKFSGDFGFLIVISCMWWACGRKGGPWPVSCLDFKEFRVSVALSQKKGQLPGVGAWRAKVAVKAKHQWRWVLQTFPCELMRPMWGKWKVGIGNSWHDMTEDIGVTQVARTCPGAAFFLSPSPSCQSQSFPFSALASALKAPKTSAPIVSACSWVPSLLNRGPKKGQKLTKTCARKTPDPGQPTPSASSLPSLRYMPAQIFHHSMSSVFQNLVLVRGSMFGCTRRLAAVAFW